MKLFVHSSACLSELHCERCRDIRLGGALRAAWAKRYEMPAGWPECPAERGAKPWGWKPNAPAKVENRPAPTVRQVRTLALAIATGKYVGDEIREEREATCAACDLRRVDDAGVPWCAKCGCGTSNAERQVRNLAAYEENLPAYGCKHPLRTQGKGWRR